MDTKTTTPEYLFESSWEVCNKVGGIYTVLSTKAHTLQQMFNDKVVFIGPDVWGPANAPDFIEDDALFADWKKHARTTDKLKMKVGRWNVPGTPPVVLIDFKPFFSDRDAFFYSMWENFRVDSMHAYGDYDESCIFAYAVGKVIESFYNFYNLSDKKVTALFNEWMLGMGALYIKKQIPAIATLFTTHATSIGRSIAGNNKALYAYMDGYNGDQMAKELNMEAKHSLEKQTALHVDCFTTVSDITARECKQLLDKAPDIVTPNGFEPNFVPEGKEYTKKRAEARKTLINVAEKLLGCPISPDALLVSTSGRYEYRNKGIDVFIEAMNRVRNSGELQREVVAFLMVPAWVRDARADLKEVIEKNIQTTSPMQMPFITHWLNLMDQDKVLNYISHAGFTNQASEKLKIIFVPCYLDGRDGIFNKPYYDLLIGMDATVYPSYYEPWGYTPLESVAFGIPTVTTNLAGFGLWAEKSVSGKNISEGVAVIERTDFNYFDVADAITASILSLVKKDKKEVEEIRKRCFKLAKQAEWSKFIVFYQKAFSDALEAATKRNS
ncbi:glycosyltransferase [Parabacteroides segnis]|jgi:glycosyltransferase involved in cell wall biosynthesis|uniref:Glycosyltransferase n=1 Tax=Parabacteroides segnis TaxID=2763058 RepID=A0ABR7E370_9BACT|nr:MULTISPECIES: glycosyltransferase [Parabacteroides]MBC5644189.1 glycosyltransferase [Parabacteroides segnis]MCM0715150.1 glycosyltransferase [Parabacteroides sp. TA-V-105]